MQQTKIVKVFLGSSITELKDERTVISALGDDISNLFSHDNIAVRFVKCENLHEGNAGVHAQKTIDQKLQDCDLSMFIFKTKAGEWTRHEYEVARALQQKKHHEIFVYFLSVPEDEKDNSLTAFRQQLDEDGVFWKECDNLSEVKHSFSMGILTHLGITVGGNAPEAEAAEKTGDDLFAQYEDIEAQQKQRQQQLHQAIDDLLAQIPSVMSAETDSISARIIEAIGLYQKADRWAGATAYDKEKYSDLLFDYAQFLYKYGLYRDAESIYLRLIPLAEELYGKEHEKTASSYNEIGVVYHAQGDYVKALEYLQKALAIWEKVLGTAPPSIATSYNNIGMVYHAQGDYGKALEYYQKALAIREEVLGTEHSSTALSYNNIGGVYHEQGDYGKALEYYQKALAIDEKVLGNEHSGTATDYNNIGSVYHMQGDYNNAMEYYQKASEIVEKVFGTEHPLTACSYNNIGEVYREQGDYGKALEYHQKALAIREKVLGTEHPSTATSYNNIGAVYDDHGDYGKALKYYQKALEIDEKVLGKEHPGTATDYNNIGVVYYEQGEFQKALEYLGKALVIRKSKLGDEHPDTQSTFGWILQILIDMGKDVEAIIDFFRNLFGE